LYFFLADATADPLPLENHINASNIIEVSQRNDIDDVPVNEIRNEELENVEAAGVEQN
jgi:hypothetical protein